jgi:putative acetyltransferase
MIYFVAGAARAGKTYMAKRLMAMLGIPLLELDYLKMGFANGLPEYGIHPFQDEATLGNLLWPYVKGIIKAMVENEDDYIIEGCYVLPEFAAEARQKHGGVIRACFLGYADMSLSEKLAEVRRYGGESGDPLRDYDDDAAVSDIQRFISYSQFVRKECARLGFPYFEVRNRERTVMSAIKKILRKGAEQRCGYHPLLARREAPHN